MAIEANALLVLGWVIWLVPFLRSARSRTAAEKVDRRARIGVALQSLAYWLLFFQPFWRSRPDALRLGAEAIFIVLGCLLSSSALRNLGKQWRVDAGLNQDHELVRSGPYRIVRHPI